jgi:XTP/dITP diphosphohydrolase
MVLIGPQGREVVTEGVCEGRIVFSPAGSGGFGYDPVFVPTGCSETFSQIGAEQKNQMSHRGQALRAMEKELHELCRA